MNSYQTAVTFATTNNHCISSSYFVHAQNTKEAREITLAALSNTYADVLIEQWHRTIQREPSKRFPGKYITAFSNLEDL